MAGTDLPTAVPSAAPPSAPAQPAQGIPRAVWAISALHLALLLAYSALVPALRGPDEYLHVDRARRLAPGALAPAAPGDASVSASTLAARDSSPAYRGGSPPVATGDARPPAERPSFSDLGPDGPTGTPNGMTEQPPLAPAIGAVVLGTASLVAGSPWPFDRVVGLLRLVDVALVAGVPLLAWATARRLGCPPRSALTATVLVLAVPQLTHAGSVVGNDALLVALGAVLFLLGARVVTGDHSVRTAVLAGGALGAGLLTSGLAVVFVPEVAGAYLLAPGAAERRAPTAPRLAAVAAVATVTGGWWWLRDLVTDGHLPLGLDASQVAPAGDGLLTLPRALATLVRSFWGNFGWLEAAVPAAAVALASAVLAAGVGIAFWRGRVLAVRLRLALFVLPTAALAAVVAGGAVVLSLDGSGAFTFQGRYLLAGLVGMVVVAAVGLDQLGRRPVPALPVLVFAGAAVLQALAVEAILTRYWAGPSAAERLRAVLAFSPWPPVLVFFTAVAVVALAAWVLVELAQVARASLPPPHPRPHRAAAA